MNDFEHTSGNSLRMALENLETERQVSDPPPDNPADNQGDPPSRPEAKTSETPSPESTIPDSLTVDQLLEHEKIGPALKSWADTQFSTQMEGKTASLRQAVRDEEVPRITEELTQQLQTQLTGKLFEKFESSDQIKELLAENSEFKQLYDGYKANGIPTSDLTARESDIARRATTHAYLSQLRTVNSLIAESDLSAEVRETLKPEVFAEKYSTDGDKAIREWTKAVHQALITHQATKLKDEEWESYKEEKLAEEEQANPNAGAFLRRGSRAAPKPDLMEGRASDHLARALARTTNGVTN